jgi:hypothetical protein
MRRWAKVRVASRPSSASAWNVGSRQRKGFRCGRISAMNGLSRNNRRNQARRKKRPQLGFARQWNRRRRAP